MKPALPFAFGVDRAATSSAHERILVPAVLLMVGALLVTGLLLILNSELVESFPHLYLLPWIIGLAIALAIPLLYLYKTDRFAIYDPLAYSCLIWLFPSFVVGGLMLTGGWSQPPFIAFIEDAPYNFPYTIVLIILGYFGFAAGYLIPIGEKIGAAAGRYLPSRDFNISDLLVPGVGLLLLGTLNTALAFFFGIIGYQKSDEVDPFSGTVYLTTLFWMQGSFILWYAIFKRRNFDSKAALMAVLMLVLTIGRALFMGNRAALLQVFLLIILAFLLAGRTLNLRKSVIGGSLLFVCVIAGMIYGTTFRNVKGGEGRVSIEKYSENVADTFEEVSRFDLRQNLELGLMTLAERLDTLSSVAVVVSNYEKLAPYEESYGLDNNIWKDTTTFFIPRILWNDKPVASEPRKYSELYFDYGESSFAITPLGDLLRNYGPIGVPIGMFVFGLILRIIYRSLVEGQPNTMWRRTLYFMLLITISFEGFYGNLVPTLFKVGITAVVGLLFVGLVARALGHRRVETPA